MSTALFSDASVLLAIVVPVHQDQRGALYSLRSLVAARYPCSTEIIFVDDGSEPALDLDLSATELHVRILRQPKRMGIEAALNKGLGEANSLGVRYVARLDAGDLVAVDRFALQFDFLESHPGTGVVGSSARFIDASGSTAFTMCPPTADRDIRRNMHVSCCLLHPTVMIRMSALAALGPVNAAYSTQYPVAEDYDLFLRLLKVSEAANLAAPLVATMLSETGLSQRRRRQQLISRLRLQLAHFDPRFLASPLGIAITILMMAVPVRLIIACKRFLGRSRW